jgi:predicted acetyltransferase
VRRARRDDLPAIQACYAGHAPRHPGWLDRPDVWWNRILTEQWDDRHVYVVDDDSGGAIAGYIVYRQSPDPERVFGYQINVTELVADEVDVALALWRLVGSSSSMVDTVTVLGPPEHPLLFLLREQDVRPRMEIRYMLRLVDAAGAIAARGYPPISATVDLDVTDRHCDWNAGRWQLCVEDGGGRLEKGGSGGVNLSVNAFAALYSGYASAGTLARAGMLRGSDRECATLDALFSGPTPWLPDFF